MIKDFKTKFVLFFFWNLFIQAIFCWFVVYILFTGLGGVCRLWTAFEIVLFVAKGKEWSETSLCTKFSGFFLVSRFFYFFFFRLNRSTSQRCSQTSFQLKTKRQDHLAQQSLCQSRRGNVLNCPLAGRHKPLLLFQAHLSAIRDTWEDCKDKKKKKKSRED